MSTIQNNINIEKEIEFLEKEFNEYGKNDYIKNELLDHKINFSTKGKVVKLLVGIAYFIESYNKIKPIEIIDFLNNLKSTFNKIGKNEVSGEEIKIGNNLLNKDEYDIKKETSLIKFYELLLGKDEAIIFIKK